MRLEVPRRKTPQPYKAEAKRDHKELSTCLRSGEVGKWGSGEVKTNGGVSIVIVVYLFKVLEIIFSQKI
jgi:hypothetical protein